MGVKIAYVSARWGLVKEVAGKEAEIGNAARILCSAAEHLLGIS